MKSSILASTLVVGALLVSASTACSDDEGGRGPYACPAVGDKNCENDTAATQADVTFCNKCKAELEAQAACLGYNRAACGADKKTVADPTDKCTAEQGKVRDCYVGGSPSDAGGGG